EAHLLAHPAHRLAFELEAVAEALGDVARRAPEAEHRVLLVGLVARTADQLAVLVRLEVGQPDDHGSRPERRRDRRDALGQALDVERARRRMPARRSEEHTSELQSRENLVCRLLLEKK